MSVGKVTQVIGSTFDAEFPEDQLPPIYNAVKIDSIRQRHARSTSTGEVQQHLGGGKVRAVALGSTDGLRRGMDCVDTGGPVTVPVGKETLGRVFNLLGEPIDNRGPVNADRAPPDPPRAAGIRRPHPQGRSLRDRHQGHRPAHPVPPRRQGRPVRRGGPRQDRRHPGTHRPYRPAARRLLRLRRRRRTHPRRHRPLAGNAGSRDRQHRQARHRPDRHGLRPDERAAGRAPPRRPLGPDDGRVLPRRNRRRHAAVHRQHLPLHAGRLGSVGAARPHAQRRRLPADAGHGNGRVAGTDHQHEERRDHVGAGRVRPRRRPHRPRPRQRVRPPGRVHLPRAQHRQPRASTPPSIRSPRRAARCRPTSSAKSTPASPARCRRCSSATAICRTSSPSWASTN